MCKQKSQSKLTLYQWFIHVVFIIRVMYIITCCVWCIPTQVPSSFMTVPGGHEHVKLPGGVSSHICVALHTGGIWRHSWISGELRELRNSYDCKCECIHW